MAADAASMVGEAALNGVFQGLAQALTPIIQKKLGQFWGVDKELKRLKRNLLGVQPLLNDAETRQFTEESVRSWVFDLRGLTYDMEDIVDEMNYELLRLQLENRDKSDGEQVQTLFTILRLDKVSGAVENYSFNYQIASKINEVLERWDEIVEYGNALNLREGVGERTLGDIRKKRETTSLVDKDRVFGRESEKEEIISFLKSDESFGRGNLSVIGIVGMGGLGKTTLAKLAYNDSDQFNMKVWVHVSHDFDLVRVTRSIIESIGCPKEEKTALDPLQCRLQELVKEKKLLLVLDDAWTDNFEDWETLLAPLIRSVQKGSKIIATTRSEEVCRSIGSRDYIYRLKGLSDDDCWTIVKEKVFDYSDNASEQANLEILRVKVVKKCQGLPLAANVIGGLLGTVHVDKWERLLESAIWELPKTKDYILPALMLSYLCLDPHQKRCFTYTATCFKHDYFQKKEMILLWMAEGFIEANKNDEMEDIANDYFDNLVAKHFFQRPYYAFHYEMHDLIRELAEVIMGNISFGIQGKIGTKRPTKEARHVALLGGSVVNQILLEKMVEAKCLRTLLITSANFDEVLKQIDHSFEHLRVLYLHGKNSMGEIPESIGDLKHLRHLELHERYIESFPDSICRLYNLQTLDLSGCNNFVELPRGIGSLINLRYLILRETILQMLPDSICKLKKLREINLQFCQKFVVLPSNIGDLNNLRGLDLYGTSVEKLPDSICRLYNLQSICLTGCNKLTELPKEMSNLINLQSFQIEEELIKTSLLPRIERFTNIRRLSNYCITNEIGIRQLNLLINLQELRITNLENVKSVEEARVANLKNKHQLVRLEMEWSGPDSSNLWDGNDEKEILEALEPPHANLRYLTVKNYGGFKFPSWLGDPSFSKLEVIKLIGCRKCQLLTSFGQLHSLKMLFIEEMQELQHVGREFFGNRAFPSLKILKLKHLPNFEGRFEAKEGDFPHLIKLEVRNCPKLRELPVTPLTLKTLILYGYEKTQEYENLSGQNPEVGNCNEMIMLKSLSNLTSLSSLNISGFRRVKLLPNGFIQSLINIKDLKIENCDELLSLPEGPSTTLSELHIINCPNMTSLGKGFLNMTCLERLEIIGCPRLESSPGELTIFSCVWYFEVVGCSKTTLSSVLPHLSTLEHLVIKEIDGLQYFPHDLLLNSTTLKYLEIVKCSELASLPDHLPSSLAELEIIGCTELTSLPDHLPSSLADLMIYKCTELTSLPDHLPSSLVWLSIHKCTELTSLPDHLPSSLAALTIDECTELTSLPDHLPSSLAELEIIGCTELTSLPNELPSSLKKFVVYDCKKIKSLPKGLCNLTSLETLEIKNCPLVESFPDDGLPTGLLSLRIYGCPTLIQRCQQQGSKEWSMIKCIDDVYLGLE
ncbi:putative disease resistance protein RGA3 [Aristolochia californica]|uniref:putative disease resistance protein RGA3 n=1 Tax=Aristolochia californica TaxID=171875 RepID=UPI0035DC310F